MLFTQDSVGVFELQAGWNPLSASDQVNTWNAACADYDGDGQVDIYLGRYASSAGELSALPDILLRNDLAESGTFVDATSDIIHMVDPDSLTNIHQATIAAEWVIWSSDSRPHLFIADARPSVGLIWFPNQLVGEEPQLDATQLTMFGGTENSIADFVFTDDDADQSFELLMTFSGSSQISRYEIEESLNNPATSGPAVSLTSEQSATSGVRVLDYDFDGDQDYLLLPGAGASPEMWRNDGSIPGRYTKVDNIGLEPFHGSASGALVTSMNGDGGAEIFLGRHKDSNAFLAVAKGDSATSENWVGVRLIESDQIPSPVLNASVVFSSGARMNVSGNGSSDHVLYLGTGGQSLTCDVEWPSLYKSEDVVLTAGQVTTIKHCDGFDSELYIIDSPTVTVTALPDCEVTYEFHWTTPMQTYLAEDSVVLNQLPAVNKDTPNVEVRQWYGVLPTNPNFPVAHHSLTWSGQPCTPGTHTFAVSSGRGGTPADSSTITFRVKVCTSQSPNLNQPVGE